MRDKQVTFMRPKSQSPPVSPIEEKQEMCPIKTQTATASLVMNNPLAFPDVFVSIFLALDMDPEDLANCAKVCTAWKLFIQNFLWQSQRVMNYMDWKWSATLPCIRDSGASTRGGEIRCFVGNSSLLLNGLYNGNIEVWQRHPEQGGEKLFSKVKTLKKGHHGSVFCLAFNDNIIVSGSFDHSICVWNRHNYELVAKLEDMHSDMVYGVSVNSKNRIVSCSHDSTVSVWQYYDDKKHHDGRHGHVEHMTALSGHVSGVKAVECDDTYVVTGSRDRTLRLWDFESGQELVKSMIRLAGSPSCLCLDWPVVVVGLKSAFFSEGDVRHLVRIYNMESGQCLRILYGHEARVMCVKMDMSCRRVVSGDESGNILVWHKLPRGKKEVGAKEDIPANVISVGASRVVGMVLNHYGLDVAIQRGSILALDFLGSE